ncbi:MAG: hypothetical protein IT458_20025 [Planctomycetes bacterium]|nr:hypothetical protein [Planctomycetota bacterium]
MRAVAVFDEVASGTSTKTLVQVVAPSNRGVRITEFAISFKGTDNLAAPIRVELLRQTTAGTASALTPRKVSRHDSNTIQTTAQQTFTAEPTADEVVRSFLIHPQGGLVYTVPDPAQFTVAGGDRLGMRVVTPAATVNCVGYIEFEE